MKSLRAPAVLASACALTVAGWLVVAGGSAGAASARPAPVTARPAGQPALLTIASALGQQRLGAFSDTFSNLYVDVPRGQVTLYATSLARGRQLVQAAKHAHPAIDVSRIRIVRAAYTMKAIDAEIANIMAGASPRLVYSAAAAPDGSGIQVTVKPGMVRRMSSELVREGRIRLTVAPGAPVTASTWRWNDSRPFIAGDVAIGNSVRRGYWSQCTLGNALMGVASRKDYIVTAAHCFPNGATVYGEGDPIGRFNGKHGIRIGRVIDVNPYWDSELIDTGSGHGGGSNSDEADSRPGEWIPVPEYGMVYNGTAVCQDGARSYYDHRGVPCGIKVVNDDVTYNERWDNGSVHAVHGEKSTARYAETPGDSGGLVFILCGTRCRDSVGQVSAGIYNSDSTLFFVSSVNITEKAFNPRYKVEHSPFT